MIHYAVVSIGSNRVLYVGPNVAQAAFWLEPGTCWGKGYSPEVAVAKAAEWAAFFRKEAAA